MADNVELKPVAPVSYKEDGTMVFNLDANLASANWMSNGRRSQSEDPDERKEAEEEASVQMYEPVGTFEGEE